jgi:hypothetical protein
MTRRLIALLVLAAAAAVVVAAPAEASPPPPPGPPSAYVQTATYNNGCTDWYLQSTYPMSATDPQWVFTCSSTDGWPDSYYWTSQDSYYWNADRQTVIQFQWTVWDSTGWYWDCTLYPYGIGACNE